MEFLTLGSFVILKNGNALSGRCFKVSVRKNKEYVVVISKNAIIEEFQCVLNRMYLNYYQKFPPEKTRTSQPVLPSSTNIAPKDGRIFLPGIFVRKIVMLTTTHYLAR
jgi:hypothetical protein